MPFAFEEDEDGAFELQSYLTVLEAEAAFSVGAAEARVLGSLGQVRS